MDIIIMEFGDAKFPVLLSHAVATDFLSPKMHSFERQSANEAAGTVLCLLLTELKKSTGEKDILLKNTQEMAS